MAAKERRVVSYSELDTTTDCIQWSGAPNKSGHGTAWVEAEGRRFRTTAHRAVWLLAGIAIPKGFELHHTCENKLCVRLTHLQLLSKAEHVKKHKQTTHCKRGHERTEKNTRIENSGARQCRICQNERQKIRREEARNNVE
jgi:hypothetical protein